MTNTPSRRTQAKELDSPLISNNDPSRPPFLTDYSFMSVTVLFSDKGGKYSGMSRL